MDKSYLTIFLVVMAVIIGVASWLILSTPYNPNSKFASPEEAGYSATAEETPFFAP